MTARPQMRAQALPGHDEARDANFRMLSGRVLNLVDPSPVDIDVNDFVVGCSRIGRWAGQTRGETGYNVLHHGVIVYETMRDVVLVDMPGRRHLRAPKAMRALGHDLHEGGGIGDIVTPIGRRIDIDTGRVNELKFRFDRAIFPAAGIPYGATEADEHEIEAAVKLADRIAAASEAIQLMGCDEDLARRRFAAGYAGRLYPRPIVPLDEVASRRAFWAAAAEAGLAIDGSGVRRAA